MNRSYKERIESILGLPILDPDNLPAVMGRVDQKSGFDMAKILKILDATMAEIMIMGERINAIEERLKVEQSDKHPPVDDIPPTPTAQEPEVKTPEDIDIHLSPEVPVESTSVGESSTPVVSDTIMDTSHIELS